MASTDVKSSDAMEVCQRKLLELESLVKVCENLSAGGKYPIPNPTAKLIAQKTEDLLTHNVEASERQSLEDLERLVAMKRVTQWFRQSYYHSGYDRITINFDEKLQQILHSKIAFLSTCQPDEEGLHRFTVVERLAAAAQKYYWENLANLVDRKLQTLSTEDALLPPDDKPLNVKANRSATDDSASEQYKERIVSLEKRNQKLADDYDEINKMLKSFELRHEHIRQLVNTPSAGAKAKTKENKVNGTHSLEEKIEQNYNEINKLNEEINGLTQELNKATLNISQLHSAHYDAVASVPQTCRPMRDGKAKPLRVSFAD